MIDLTQLQDQIKKKLSVIENQPELENTKSFFLGKKGLITLAFKELGTLDVTIRKEQASKLNIIKSQLTDKINALQQDIASKEINKKLNTEKLDITLPAKKIIKGKMNNDLMQISHQYLKRGTLVKIINPKTKNSILIT